MVLLQMSPSRELRAVTWVRNYLPMLLEPTVKRVDLCLEGEGFPRFHFSACSAGRFRHFCYK